MNGKAARQEALRRIIKDTSPGTQAGLAERLAEAGFRVTQATLSRDISEMGIAKVRDGRGRSIYVIDRTEPAGDMWKTLKTMTASFVSGVDRTGNLVVLRTRPGYAQGVASAIDGLNEPAVLGSVAGDDTILVVIRDDEQAAAFAARLSKEGKGDG
jgi:transcriptional regulator of arginine metabolism